MPCIECPDSKKWRYGEDGDCVFDTEADCKKAEAAIHAQHNEGKAMSVVKALNEDGSRVGGILVPFGSETEKDLDDEWFSQNTANVTEWFDALGTIPILAQHDQFRELVEGNGGEIPADWKTTGPIGKITKMELHDEGYYVEGILQAVDKAQEDYVNLLKRLTKEGRMHWSSRTLHNRKRKNKSTGEIWEWPTIEGTLTPTPANPYRAQAFAKSIQDALEAMRATDSDEESEHTGEDPVSQAAAQDDPDPEKAESLDERTRRIRAQFREQFKNDEFDGPYVEELYVDHLIARDDENATFFRVNYSATDSEITFSPRAEWVEVQREWVPVPRTNADLAARQEIARRELALLQAAI